MAWAIAAGVVLAPPAEAQWSLAPPDVTIDEGSGVEFSLITDLLVYENRIYVADWGFTQIHAFDLATGDHIVTTGREGEGPREFQGPLGFDHCGGDSVFVSDRSFPRISVYSLELDYLRTITLPRSISRAEIGCTGSSGFVVQDKHRDPMLVNELIRSNEDVPKDPYSSTFDIVFFAPDGSHRMTMGPFTGEERYRSVNSGGWTDRPVTWGFAPMFGVSRWGFVLGSVDAWSLLVRYDPEGNVRDTIGVDTEPLDIPRSHINADIEEWVRFAETQGRDLASTRRRWSEHPYPSHYPVYSDVQAVDGGFVWVERFSVPYPEPQPPLWEIFGPDGTLEATVDFPSGFELMWVGDTHVAGIVKDELDVPSVEVRPIQRR